MLKRSIPPWWVLIFIAALTIAILVLNGYQIFTADTATKTETALFNVLQFLFSLLFAVILTRVVSEHQFLASQRKFAIGAFRRIKEIERLITRTEKYVWKPASDGEYQTNRAVIGEALISAKDIVRFSVADWTDIIGDEIEVEIELRRLKKLRDEREETDKITIDSSETDQLYFLQEKIEKLEKELPAELRVITEDDELDYVQRGVDRLADIWSKERVLRFLAFWEPTDSFKANIDTLSVGDTVFIAKGFTEHRSTPFLVYDGEGNWMAVVTNLCVEARCDYETFIAAIERFYNRALLPISFDGVPLEGKVVEIEAYDPVIERRYIKIQVDTLPSHACVDEAFKEERG